VDPSGEFITWSIGKNGLSIGFNLTPIGIPIGAGINMGWSNGASAGIYVEFGPRIGGTGLGSGFTQQYSLDYNFKHGSRSTTTSVGAYASVGPFTAGVNFSITYTTNNDFPTAGWGVYAGIGIGGEKGSLGFTVGYGSAGWSYGIGGSYYTAYERAYGELGQGQRKLNPYRALYNKKGRISTPFFVRDESLAMNIIWVSSFNEDGSVKCETAMYDVYEGYVIIPNIDNTEHYAKTYWGCLVKDRVISLNGNEYYVEAIIHTHPNDGGIGISIYDRSFNQTIPVYIIYKGNLYDVNGNYIKKVIK